MPFLVHWRGRIALSSWRGREEALRAVAAASAGAGWLAASAASSLAIGGMIAHPDQAQFWPILADDLAGDQAMNRTEALKVLHLDEGSDGHAVETSYWTLVRHAQTRSPDETTAAREVEELNRAYAALTPTPSRDGDGAKARTGRAGRARAASTATAARSGASDDNIIDGALTWLGEEAARRPSAMGRAQRGGRVDMRCSRRAGGRRAHGQRLVADRAGLCRRCLRRGMVAVAQRTS